MVSVCQRGSVGREEACDRCMKELDPQPGAHSLDLGVNLEETLDVEWGHVRLHSREICIHSILLLTPRLSSIPVVRHHIRVVQLIIIGIIVCLAPIFSVLVPRHNSRFENAGMVEGNIIVCVS